METCCAAPQTKTLGRKKNVFSFESESPNLANKKLKRKHRFCESPPKKFKRRAYNNGGNNGGNDRGYLNNSSLNSESKFEKLTKKSTSSQNNLSGTDNGIIALQDNRAWEQNERPRTVRGAIIFGMLSLLHSALVKYFRDDQAAPLYVALACVSFSMAAYASCAETARSFQRVLRVILLIFAILRVITIAFFVDCTSNSIGSTCTQLSQKKYPMRWTMEAVAVLTLATSLSASSFRLLACIEIMWVFIALREVQPTNLAEYGVVAEVLFGLVLLMLCTYSQLHSNEIMRNTISSRQRTDRIINHRKNYVNLIKNIKHIAPSHWCKGTVFAERTLIFPTSHHHHDSPHSFVPVGIKNILADTYSTLLLYPKGLANLQDLQRSAESVQRASRSIQNSLNLSQLLNPEFHGVNAEPERNTREVKLRSWIREHGPADPFQICAQGSEFAATFIIHEILATGHDAHSNVHHARNSQARYRCVEPT